LATDNDVDGGSENAGVESVKYVASLQRDISGRAT